MCCCTKYTIGKLIEKGHSVKGARIINGVVVTLVGKGNNYRVDNTRRTEATISKGIRMHDYGAEMGRKEQDLQIQRIVEKYIRGRQEAKLSKNRALFVLKEISVEAERATEKTCYTYKVYMRSEEAIDDCIRVIHELSSLRDSSKLSKIREEIKKNGMDSLSVILKGRIDENKFNVAVGNHVEYRYKDNYANETFRMQLQGSRGFIVPRVHVGKGIGCHVDRDWIEEDSLGWIRKLQVYNK